MNINLSKAAGKQKKKGLSLGLNARGNVFEDKESSTSSDEETPATGREAVNRAIAKEQAALRERATAAAADIAKSQIYDYDGAYDSFQKTKNESASSKASGKDDDSKKSRYIGDLLKAAEQRQRERDVVYERKVAREQAAEEEAEPEFRGKDRFVTAGYKRKLEERKIWQEQEEKQQKLEEKNDVTKQTDGVASFYGNLNKNIAMGGGETKENDKEPGFLDGFAKADDSDNNREEEGKKKQSLPLPDALESKDVATAEDPVERRKRMRLLREKKVEEARARYFQRKAASAGTTQ